MFTYSNEKSALIAKKNWKSINIKMDVTTSGHSAEMKNISIDVKGGKHTCSHTIPLLKASVEKVVESDDGYDLVNVSLDATLAHATGSFNTDLVQLRKPKSNMTKAGKEIKMTMDFSPIN